MTGSTPATARCQLERRNAWHMPIRSDPALALNLDLDGSERHDALRRWPVWIAMLEPKRIRV